MSGFVTIFNSESLPKKKKENAIKKQKKRSDAKNDIKFRLSAGDVKELRFQAMRGGLSLTAHNSQIVRNELQQPRDYEPAEYDHNGKFVHVMLEKEVFEIVQRLSIEWDLPLRHVAHRIVKDHIRRSTGELKIIDYRSGEK